MDIESLSTDCGSFYYDNGISLQYMANNVNVNPQDSHNELDQPSNYYPNYRRQIIELQS